MPDPELVALGITWYAVYDNIGYDGESFLESQLDRLAEKFN